MALEIKQQLKVSQQLKMTPQLQQAIKLLQLSRMELVELVQQEMVENPVLEEGQLVEGQAEGEHNDGEDRRPTDMAFEGVDQESVPDRQTDVTREVRADGSAVSEIDWDSYLEHHNTAPPMPPSQAPSTDENSSFEGTLTQRPSLSEHLIWQLKLCSFTEEEEQLALFIIGNLDNNGYFNEPPLDELAREANVPLDVAETVLMRIQTFDPVGIASRDLKECLLIQARHSQQDDEVLVRIITQHLHNLERKNYQAIAKDLNQPLEEIYEAVKVIATFDPKPGRLYTEEEPVYITPDVYVHKLGDRYYVVPNDDGLPKLRISNFYRSAMSGGQQARQYVQDKLRSAQWLIRSIQQRQRTIIRVTESIIKFQRDFFDKGVNHLRPLILRDVAEDIQMHESTISRVTTNKYVHTPQGIFELKYFFNSGINRTDGDDIASESVKSKIRELVTAEDHKQPVSDQRLVELLREQNIEIARRTVAKYREQMGILSSSKRKQVF